MSNPSFNYQKVPDRPHTYDIVDWPNPGDWCGEVYRRTFGGRSWWTAHTLSDQPIQIQIQVEKPSREEAARVLIRLLTFVRECDDV